jgi:hypothetical protein
LGRKAVSDQQRKYLDGRSGSALFASRRTAHEHHSLSVLDRPVAQTGCDCLRKRRSRAAQALDGRGHDPNVVETWRGDSIGHWEGNGTLVVETAGQNAITWLDQDGHVHTNEMVVTERFRRPDPGHLEIGHTINDPGAYSKPSTFTTHPVPLKGELIEYICRENNRDVQHRPGNSL